MYCCWNSMYYFKVWSFGWFFVIRWNRFTNTLSISEIPTIRQVTNHPIKIPINNHLHSSILYPSILTIYGLTHEQIISF
jgi:hypothetical protein